METKAVKPDYKFLKYHAQIETQFLTLSNKFKLPKNELLKIMLIYFDKTGKDPRELNFDNSMERVIKILNKNERDYLKPIYSFLLDSAIQKDDTIQLLESLVKKEEIGNEAINQHRNLGNAREKSDPDDQSLSPELRENIFQLFLGFANEVAKVNEFERREVFNDYKSKINQIL